MTKTPLLYYPTTVCFVDDSGDFLDSLKSLMEMNGNPLHRSLFFSKPEDLLEHLKGAPKRADILGAYAMLSEEDQWEHKQIDVNFHDVAHISHNKNRFDQVLVVVADYQMPSMTGLELAEHLKPYGVKTILLTGEADETKAIQAFNQRLIDRFLKKESTNLSETLETYIQELLMDAQEESTHLFKEALQLETQDTAYGRDGFMDFLKDYFLKSKAVEYYPMGTTGSSLFVDQSGDLELLHVLTLEQNLALLDLHVDQSKLDDTTLQEIQSGKKIICVNPKGAGGYTLSEAQSIPGVPGFFFAVQAVDREADMVPLKDV